MARYPTPVAETPKGKREAAKYLSALGRFIDMFSRAENAVRVAVEHYSQIPHYGARALLGTTRMDAGCSALARLFEAKLIPQEKWNDLRSVTQQLGVINGRRNEILHQGTYRFSDGRLMITNASSIHISDKAWSYPISATMLDAMTADLRKAIIHLHTRHMGRPPLKGRHADIQEILRAPWRYRSLEQASRQSKTRENAQGSHRQPRPSKG